MELTKYAHACVLLAKDGQHLLIDPGGYTELPADLPKIDVLVITHAHGDHFDKAKIEPIIIANPDVQIYGTPEVANGIVTPSVTIPETDQDYTAGSFTLKFYGGQHDPIHKSMNTGTNFGVSVDGQVYYPGDSFSPGPKEIKVLLAPDSGPWLKIGETIQFVIDHKAKLVVPTHDIFLSDSAISMNNDMLGGAVAQYGGEFKRLQPGESITL